MFTYTIKEVNEYTREISGEIAKEATERQFQKVSRDVRRDIVIPGFRRGKAPWNLLKSHFGDQIKSRVTEELFSEFFPKIMEETKLHIVSQPSITNLDYEFGKPLTFTITAEIVSMEEPKDYLGIEVELQDASVTEEAVDQQLNLMRSRFGELKVVEDRNARVGDYVIIDVRATHEGQEVESLLREKVQVAIGRNMVVNNPAFDEHLVDMARDEQKEFSLTFPEDDADVELAGKEISFQVTISEVKAIVLPPLDDEFAKGLGHFKTLESLKKAIRNEVLSQNIQRQREQALNNMFDKIIAANPIVLPPRIITNQINSFASRYTSPKDPALSEEEKEARFGDMARRSLYKTLLIEKIAEKEKISVEDEEIKQVYASWLEIENRYGQRNKTEKPEDRMDQIRLQLMEEKTLELIFQKAVKQGVIPELEKLDLESDEDMVSQDEENETGTADGAASEQETSPEAAPATENE